MLNLSVGVGARFRALVLIAGIILAGPLQAAPLELTINGSNTIGAQLAPRLVQEMLHHLGAQDVRVQLNAVPGEHLITAISADAQPVSIRLNAHGSGTGFSGLNDRTGHIAAASRPIKESEAQALQSAGDMRGKEAEQIIGLDGLAVIVNPSSAVAALSVEQLAGIFSGQITHWHEVGGHNAPISLHVRDQNSGTWETFRELVLAPRQLPLHDRARRYQSNAALADAVNADAHGIGFVGLASVGNARALAISSGQSLPMLPTRERVATEDYPLTRRLFMYIRPDETNRLARELVSFVQSEAGQAVVDEVGFVGQNLTTVFVEPLDGMPEDYRRLAEQAVRLSVNFRFEEGSARLDNKALQDLDRVVRYLREHGKTEDDVVLVGFSDPRRSNAELLSRLRAMTVRRALVQHRIYTREIIGIGSTLPVATNAHDDGRFRNRRVELWVY
ncbi:substrate-binding domain-containing protein [Halopseudomonas pertucinogena]|uniref:OmpA-like domain-containing protein n=1 Tax=Halopseudomonas pertucinogena TaxID=86175 RepID=A0ABQ2CN71_9GAMM|nr:phosphate ABC transporter substrate-binding/OmpA family protein [Halopseudomonas pertucinogena]GGI97104.1 hypothetical protein GCM10009083_12220 [Halopseudomonas pertucinogena]